MIPVKLFQRLTDYEEEYLNNPTRENYDRVTNLQVEIDWPYKANQEHLDYWNRMNHDPDNYWLEGTSARRQGQPISSASLQSFNFIKYKLTEIKLTVGVLDGADQI